MDTVMTSAVNTPEKRIAILAVVPCVVKPPEPKLDSTSPEWREKYGYLRLNKKPVAIRRQIAKIRTAYEQWEIDNETLLDTDSASEII